MRVLVTGATGFIGRHVLAQLLNRQGVEILAAVRRHGPQPALDARVSWLPLDLADAPAGSFARCGRPDVMIHLAWDGLPNYRSAHHLGQELPQQRDFLHAMVSEGLPALVVSGTCFEYGMQDGALDETMPAHPQNAYGQAKDALRQYLQRLQADLRPFALTWARLFYLYGEGQSASALFGQLSAAVARGDRVFPMSGGEQLRDYLPVTEAARALVHLALHSSGLGPGVLNVCSGQPVAVRTLVREWLQKRGWDIALELGALPYPTHEPMAFWGRRDRLVAAMEAP